MSVEEAKDYTSLLGGDIVFTRAPQATITGWIDVGSGSIQHAADQVVAMTAPQRDESRVLSLIDGHRTVVDILRVSPLPHDVTLQHLRSLSERGLLISQKPADAAPTTEEPAPPRPKVVVIDTRHRDRLATAARSVPVSGPASAVSYLPTALSSVTPNLSFDVPDTAPANGGNTASPSGGSAPFRLGSYEVATRIGQGGMGSVYVCRKPGAAGSQRLFALKVVRQHSDQQELAVRSLLREARVGAWVNHPNVQGVVDVGTYKAQPFLIMDYIEGVSLADLIYDERRLPPAVAVSILLDVLRGLERVHGLCDEQGTPRGLVHCDVSPPNVLVGADGVGRITDFGSCRIMAEEGPNRPDPVKLGKPSFMAPEQLCAEPLDRRTDVFAVGAMMFAALTGQEVFAADSYDQIVLNVLRKRIPPPSAFGAPACLDEICRHALGRSREGRFASAEVMAQALLKTALANDLLASPNEVAQHVRSEFGEFLEEQRRRIQSAFEGGTTGRAQAWDSSSGVDTQAAAENAPTPGDDAKPDRHNAGAEKKKFARTLFLPASGPEPEAGEQEQDDQEQDEERAPITRDKRTDKMMTVGKDVWRRIIQERWVIYASVALGVALMTITVLLTRHTSRAPAAANARPVTIAAPAIPGRAAP
jgi:serine/threonine protein kinase